MIGARVVVVVAMMLAAACGSSSGSGAMAPGAPALDLPPLPPDSPTVVGALLAHADELALTTDQRAELERIDAALRDDLRPYEADLADRREAGAPPKRERPPGGGGGRGGPGGGGGMGGPGGMGGGGGGMGGPPSGGGGGGGGMGGPPPGGGGRGGPDGASRPPPPPRDPALAAADRAAIEDLELTIERLQREAQDAAMAVLPDTARERGLQLVNDFWTNDRARRTGAPIGHPLDGAAP